MHYSDIQQVQLYLGATYEMSTVKTSIQVNCVVKNNIHKLY